MNRRSPPAPATITGEEITNFYQVMPSKFKPVIKNPNKHLHGFDLPFRLIVCAPSGSGKTNFVANLLQLFSAGEGSFTDILVLTKNSDEPIYNYLKEKAKGIVIKEGLGNNLPNLDKTEEKEDQKLIVLDDLVLEKNQTNIESYFVRCRKFGYSIVYITQSWFRVPKTIRLNTSYVAILKIGSKRDLNLILSEVSIGVNKDQLTNMYDFATHKKMDVLLIHVEKPVSQKFHRNFLQVLNPEAFYDSVLGENY